MNPTRPSIRCRGARGSALVIVLIVIIVLAGLGLALSMTTHSASEENNGATDEMRVAYVADAAVNEAAAVLLAGGRAALNAMTYPRTLRGTSYDVHVTYGDLDPALGDDLVRLVGTAELSDTSSSVELTLREVAGGDLSPGAFGDEIIEMDAGSIVDSYDSSAGTYASQATNTWSGNSYAGSNGAGGSNDAVLVKGTSAVMGDARPGPLGTATVTAGSLVTGSTAPAASTKTLPAITLPAIAQGGPYSLDGSSATLTAGSHGYTTFDMKNSAVLTIEGPATLLIDTLKVQSLSKIDVDTSGGPVEIYVKLGWTLDGARMAPLDADPAGLSVKMTPVASDLHFKNACTFMGMVYAPDGYVKMANNAAIFGSVIAKRIKNNNARIHVDENLVGAGTGGGTTLSRASWRPLSPVQAEAITGP